LLFSRFSWIAWVSEHFLFRFVNSCEKVLSFCLNLLPPFGEIVIYPNWKDL